MLGEEPVKKSKTEGDWANLPSVTFKPFALSFFFFTLNYPLKLEASNWGEEQLGSPELGAKPVGRGKKHVHHTQRYSFLGEKLW